jgi:nitrogen fixation/metabolism regulation signal transduction histidine kinase
MPIRAAVETLRRLRARNDPRFDDYFDEASRTVLDEVQRIATIVSEFTRFARLPPPRPTVTDPKEVAAYVASLHDGKDNIPVVVLADADVPTVMADRDQIVQVLINLVQNAQDAVRSANEADLVHQTPESEGVSSEPHVPAGAPARSVGAKAPGTAERTEPVGASPRQVTIRLRARESLEGARASGRAKVSTLLASRRRDDRPAPRLTDGVIIEVEDDGNGVPAEFVEHLFEPYATTKSHGTGLGLAIAARIAVEHGGDLSYEARNPGARFRLFLSEIGSFAPASTRGDG